MTDKFELIRLIHEEQGRWDELVALVGSERMAERGVNGDWSMKDVIAHLTAWEERAIACLEAAVSGGTEKPAEWPDGLNEEKTNDWIFKSNRDRLATDVIAHAKRVHQNLVELVQILPEKALMDPNLIKSLDGQSLMDAIPGDSYAHYRGHEDAVRSWLEREGASPAS